MDDLDAIARTQLGVLLANNNGRNNPMTPQQFAEAIRQHAIDQLKLEGTTEEVEQQGIPANEADINEALEKGIELITEIVEGNPQQRVQFSEESLQKYFDGEDPSLPPPDRRELPSHNGFDIISAISDHPVIAARLGAFLPPRDLVNLFSISREFNATISKHLLSSIVVWLRANAPNAVSDFPFKLYGPSTTRDPAGRPFAYEMYHPVPKEPWVNTTRIVPSLRWYYMVANRERYAQQITAFMARSGHRLPPTMTKTLKRMWLIMDIASNSGRIGFMKNTRFWTDTDLYNVQMFCVKLDLLFNDPIRGPADDCMTKLMLGQRGLFPLWQLLYRKKFTTIPEIVELKVRYDYKLRRQHTRTVNNDINIFGIPIREVGRGHLEGWGVGFMHLYRPDELGMAESTRRQLNLESHLEGMAWWGHLDWNSGRHVVPSEEEMHLEDEDELLDRVDTSVMFKMRHPKKMRWDTLTEEEQEEIRLEERVEEIQAVKLARGIGYVRQDGVVEKYPEGGLPVLSKTDKDNYNLNWEARRGWTSERLTKEQMDAALEEMPLYERQPTKEEQQELEVMIKDDLSRAADLFTEDEILRAQATYNYDDSDLELDHEEYAAQLDNNENPDLLNILEDDIPPVHTGMTEAQAGQLMAAFLGFGMGPFGNLIPPNPQGPPQVVDEDEDEDMVDV